VRAKVERPFRVLKQQFGYAKVHPHSAQAVLWGAEAGQLAV